MSATAHPLRADAGRHALGWHGMMTLIVTEASLFVYLLFSYYYFVAQAGRSFFPSSPPEFRLAGPNTLVLIASSGTVWLAQRAARRHSRGGTMAWLGVTIILGLAFLAVQFLEWKAKPFTLSTNAYGSFYFTIAGFHMAHVAVGVAMLLLLFLWEGMNLIDERRNAPVGVGAAYWHFVDVVWLSVFFSFYLLPYL